jgi:hypothetical protein
MPRGQLSAKRIAIDKANTTVVIAVGVAAFIVVFSLVASKALLSQRSYQAKVINRKEEALRQLNTNIKESEKLAISYEEFNGAPINVLGGNPKGTGDKDGENSRIVLDALPSKYDFPALATSINKLIASNGLAIESISGTDDEANQSVTQTSENPSAIDIPFGVESKQMPASDGKKFIELFERSIRPIQIQKISISGQDNNLKISIKAKTYYQPGKNLDIKSEVVTNGKKAAPAAKKDAK